jgi:parallel beta-helix repeat protein
MGADTGQCEIADPRGRIVHVAAGTYAFTSLNLALHVSLRGASAEETILEGTVFGIQTGAILSGVTVTKGGRGGVQIGSGRSPEITDCVIARNEGSSLYYEHCGVVCGVGASPVLRRCSISSNAYPGLFCDEESSPTLQGCVIQGNAGSGLVLYEATKGRFVNCTISRNRAEKGAAVFLWGLDHRPVFMNCTITGNTSTEGGVVRCGIRSSPALINCIIWGNSPNTFCGELTHCLTAEDPLFVDPENGDYRLQAGSPAIDMGALDGAPCIDLDGYARPCGAGVDIGAYEYGSCPPPTDRFLRGDSNADGKLNVADPVYTLLYIFVAGHAPTCLDTADANDDGTINVADAVYALQFLFVDGPVIPPPFPECGVDPTLDELGCLEYSECQ